MLKRITVHGARQHNLKNIDVEIPRNTFTVITGLSGSGKSSLAFDTIYAEGQRRYVETLSPRLPTSLSFSPRLRVSAVKNSAPLHLQWSNENFYRRACRGRRTHGRVHCQHQWEQIQGSRAYCREST